MDKYDENNQYDQDVESMQQPRFPFGPPFGRPFRPRRPPFGPGTPPFGPPFGPGTPPFGPPIGPGAPPFGPPTGPGTPPFGPPTGPPTAPPPRFTPQQPPSLFFVDPGAIRPCLFRFSYIWLTTGQAFWAYLVFQGPNSVAGFRWTGFSWIYFGTDLRNISTFVCY